MNQNLEFLEQLPKRLEGEKIDGEIRPLALQWICIKWAINIAAGLPRSWPHSSGGNPEWAKINKVTVCLYGPSQQTAGIEEEWMWVPAIMSANCALWPK